MAVVLEEAEIIAAEIGIPLEAGGAAWPLGIIEPIVAPINLLGAMLLALTAAIFIYQLETIVRLMVGGFVRPIPGIGRPTADWIDSHVVAITRGIHGWAEQQILPLTHAIASVNNRVRRLLRAETLTHVTTLAALRRIRYDDLPRVETAILTFVQHQVAAVLQYVQAADAQLARYVDAQTQRAIAYASSRADQAQALTLQTRAELLAEDRLVLAQAQQVTASLALQVDRELERAARVALADDQAVIAYAQQLAGQSNQYARQLAAQQQAHTDDAVAQAERQAIAIGAGVLALVLPALASLGQRVTQIEDSPCQQKCQTLGQLGSNLDGLDLAALLALLVGASAHPHEAAPIMTDLLAPGARLVSGQLAGLFK